MGMTHATKSMISLGMEESQGSLLGPALHTLRPGAGGTHLSLVKTYPSTFLMAAKMDPTITENTPENTAQS